MRFLAWQLSFRGPDRRWSGQSGLTGKSGWIPRARAPQGGAMSVTLDDYSAVVGQVYEASLDVSAWERTLDVTCRFVGASKAVLGSLSLRERQYDLQVNVGYEPGWIDLFHSKYAAVNPLNTATANQDVGEVRCISEYGLIGAFEGDPMYEEWVKPQGIFDIAEVVLDRSLSHVGVLDYTRVEADGIFPAEAIGRIKLLFPHVRRSVLIGRVLKMHRRGEGELAQVIGGLAAGVFMLSATGDVLRCNAAGETLLVGKSLLAPPGGRLRFADEAADRAFAEAMRSAGVGSAALCGKGVSIPLRGQGGAKYVAHLLPLSAAAAEDDLNTRGARMAVFVSLSHPDLTGALRMLSETYDLTAAERRVALALVEVGSTPMIAEALGVSVATVRTHLRSLFQKTGARRQTEIVTLLRGFVSPFG
jgi:DNA-binding CsgD family transcriptional regulator